MSEAIFALFVGCLKALWRAHICLIEAFRYFAVAEFSLRMS